MVAGDSRTEQRNITDSSLDDYVQMEKIAEGWYSTVHKCLHKQTNRVVAMKEIRLLEYHTDEGIPPNVLREISILKDLKHPNIVSFFDCIVEGGASSLYLIFEFLSTDLEKRLASLEPSEYLSHGTISSYLHQILQGTLFCHVRRILHRDIKPGNLLLTVNGVIKLADFGVSRRTGVPGKTYSNEVVTLVYKAPELLLGSERYWCPIDIWSIGCTFAEMSTKKVLFDGESEIDVLYCIFRIMKTPTVDIWPGLSTLQHWHNFPCWEEYNLEKHVTRLDRHGMDLLEKMLTYDPSKRISARDALKHPYFDDLDKSKLPANNF